MSIYFGNDTVNDLYIGLTPVTKGYVGTHLFYNGDNTIIDLTYEKYILNTQYSTLYNTAEKPVKSAILKGNTLVNQSTTSELTFENAWQGKMIEGNALQSGKKYFVSFDLKSDSSELSLQARNEYSFVYHIFKGFTKGKNVLSFILEQDANGLRFQAGNDFNVKISNIIILEYQEDMENWNIPYFIGIQSVKMPILTTSNEDGTKTNILTVNEPVELRGIDDVQDTLDCLTGEVTERIGEVVLDGSENWTKYGGYNLDGYSSFVASMPSLNNLYKKSMSFISADFAMASWSYYVANKGVEVVWNHDRDKIGIRVKSEKASNVTEIKEFLSTNNIRISYKLATESIKTVDLSVVDQDGNNAELSTFNDITHVTLSSEGLIPEAELEVATKNEEVLNTMSLEMDDISTTQTTLEETSNTQSENVDATMIATTEIYEGLL